MITIYKAARFYFYSKNYDTNAVIYDKTALVSTLI